MKLRQILFNSERDPALSAGQAIEECDPLLRSG
jgi:hypothetical protein